MAGGLIKKIKSKGIIFSLRRAAGIAVHTPVSAVYKKLLMKTTKIRKNQILLCSLPSFTDNAKALYDHLQKEYSGKYRIVWLIFKEDEMPKGDYPHTRFIRANSFYHRGYCLPALKAVAQSRYILFTHSSPIAEIPKRKGQLAVNLWHGCGYKAKEKTARTGLQINPFDYVLVPGPVFIGTKAEFWGCSEDTILPIGYPRYDLMLRGSERAEEYCSRLRGSSDKLIFWLPTFRKTGRDKYPEERVKYAFEIPLLSSADELNQLNELCRKANVTICLKRHPMQVRYESEKLSLSNIRFISNKDIVDAGVDFYAMLHYADAMISDYSSVSIDFLLMNRPIAFALEDLKQYQDVRGFVFDDPLHYMPGHHLYSYSDLSGFISDTAAGNDPYSSDRDMIMNEVHNPCDDYCRRVWDKIKSL